MTNKVSAEIIRELALCNERGRGDLLASELVSRITQAFYVWEFDPMWGSWSVNTPHDGRWFPLASPKFTPSRYDLLC